MFACEELYLDKFLELRFCACQFRLGIPREVGLLWRRSRGPRPSKQKLDSNLCHRRGNLHRFFHCKELLWRWTSVFYLRLGLPDCVGPRARETRAEPVLDGNDLGQDSAPASKGQTRLEEGETRFSSFGCRLALPKHGSGEEGCKQDRKARWSEKQEPPRSGRNEERRGCRLA